MIYADKITFNRGDEKRLETIVRIHLFSTSGEGISGWYYKEDINEWLHENSYKIVVYIDPYPELIPVDGDNVKYVRSSKDDTEEDNLLKLDTYYEKQ
ncbi:hypothetical protein Lpp41_00685 [Lacticaseibacillus paracasei subsp. paracasei Lpp41]|uniref:DUF3892 domain-containing protein n=1 Tax=Lacticaseibacillus paracasei subsp. paracasei Lpp41 TaxID=1256208 RepID=A0A829HA46_LACPA|nr:hypothetical protein Lpp41_00685 [Lacticaseibacillus paracasei subsp. paracasei Lpp41]